MAGTAKPPGAVTPPTSAGDGTGSVLERMLSRPGEREANTAGALAEATVAAWSEARGMLADGRRARLGASCLLRPAPGDRVLLWERAGEAAGDRPCWVLAVLERARGDAAAVLSADAPLAIQAPRVGVSARTVHIASEDFLTSTRNHHEVAETHTATARVRVTQTGTDIRRSTTVDEQIQGALLQRVGTWISDTARDARLRARAFLFD